MHLSSILKGVSISIHKNVTSGCSTVSLNTGELATSEVNNLCCQRITCFDIFKGNKMKLRS